MVLLNDLIDVARCAWILCPTRAVQGQSEVTVLCSGFDEVTILRSH